ncbi:MAG TPA: sigma-70 family RNA polymerase sigma factor [Gemmataceae bacterium]|nr:sigma-70 family RNA polymerase sigma factor [Gemmataceae bacterium]
MSSASTSSSLLRRVQGHDQEAWSRLVDWAGPLVYFWCRKAGLAAEDREDVFQDVFLKVSRGITTFDTSAPGSSFRGWLLTITRRAIIDLARRRLNEPRAVGGSEAYQRLCAVSEAELSSGGPSAPDSQEQRSLAALALIRGEFTEQTWRAFWRSAVDGLSAPEVAAELGMTPLAVRKAKSRVAARLRQEFGDLLE